jgi:hypothetical protein
MKSKRSFALQKLANRRFDLILTQIIIFEQDGGEAEGKIRIRAMFLVKLRVSDFQSILIGIDRIDD